VINLEGHNLSSVDPQVIPETVELLTIDVGYLSLAEAIPQVDKLRIDWDAHLVALVKPTFELRRPKLAASDDDIGAAVSSAAQALQKSGWTLLASCPAAAIGRGGAREVFLHACRSRA
jgi:predicted rRNA methylase YqxC with S4 and FtsJ domains